MAASIPNLLGSMIGKLSTSLKPIAREPVGHDESCLLQWSSFRQLCVPFPHRGCRASITGARDRNQAWHVAPV